MLCVSLSKVSFHYAGADDLFSNISAAFHDNQIVAIIGDNGCGKTTLLNLIAGNLEPTSGTITRGARVYLMPQMSEYDSKSGGEHQQKILAAAFGSGADILLLDEPTNNLDAAAKEKLFNDIFSFNGGIVLISHDRELLNRVNVILELKKDNLKLYNGNYDYYLSQKQAEQRQLEARLSNTENRIARLNKTKTIALECAATGQKKLNQTRQKALQCGNHKALSGIRDASDKLENVMVKKLRLIQKKLDEKAQERQQISESLRDDKIKIPLPKKPFLRNELLRIENMSFGYNDLIFDGFNFSMRGGERVRIGGQNGCGKTTLLKLILGRLRPQSGEIKLFGRASYLDQSLSLLDYNQTIVDNIMNLTNLNLNQSFAIAANFGFRNEHARKRVGILSGGELLKATLCVVLGSDNQPDLLILDEPTNNLDLKSIAILEDALNQYRGAILLVSHDELFVRNINIDREIEIGPGD